MKIEKVSADTRDWLVRGYVPNLPNQIFSLSDDERWNVLNVLLDCLTDSVITGMKESPDTFKEKTGKNLSEISSETWEKCKKEAELNHEILINYAFTTMEAVVKSDEIEEKKDSDKVIPIKTKE